MCIKSKSSIQYTIPSTTVKLDRSASEFGKVLIAVPRRYNSSNVLIFIIDSKSPNFWLFVMLSTRSAGASLCRSAGKLLKLLSDKFSSSRPHKYLIGLEGLLSKFTNSELSKTKENRKKSNKISENWT